MEIFSRFYGDFSRFMENFVADFASFWAGNRPEGREAVPPLEKGGGIS